MQLKKQVDECPFQRLYYSKKEEILHFSVVTFKNNLILQSIIYWFVEPSNLGMNSDEFPFQRLYYSKKEEILHFSVVTFKNNLILQSIIYWFVEPSNLGIIH